MGPITLLAIWSGKVALALSRLMGKGGSTFPGRIARKIDKHVLFILARQHSRGNIVISGTNGKTTTAKMISDILTLSGAKPAHNRTGANLIYGITSEFVRRSSLFGRMPTDIGLCEVDEATMPYAARELKPSIAVVTNFFRDQLDRFGEVDTTVSLVKRGIAIMPKSGTVVANADDPLAASTATSGRHNVIYYGIEDESQGLLQRPQVADVKRCPKCGTEFTYQRLYYAHLGLYNCENCGYSRPSPQVMLTRYTRLGARGSIMSVTTPAGDIELRLALPGIYNAYNALAAVACAVALSIPLNTVEKAISSFTSSFGRMELLPIAGKDVFIALVKNPTGFNEVIRTLLEGPEQKRIIIAINDRYADGTDVSWLWDVDFEQLAGMEASISFVITAGIRAEDMAVRLKYAGLNEAKVTVENDIKCALDLALTKTSQGELLYILPTYTAMLEVRDVLHSMGYARQFWEV